MSDTLERHYLEIIDKLKKDQRPLIVLDADLIAELQERWSRALETKDLLSMQKVLCLLDNSQTYSNAFQQHFITTLNQIEDKETLIYLLGAASKHMITEAQRKGDPINGEWTMSLEKLLATPDYELLEWALRTLDQYGPQSIRFKEAILKRKPGRFAVFNEHKKNCRELIMMFERRWSDLVKRL